MGITRRGSLFKLTIFHIYFIILSIILTTFSYAADSTQVSYDDVFPLYAQPCALTQIKKSGKSSGGSAGHAVIYIKGMCRDRNAPYPRVEVCDNRIDIRNPDSGTLISVNKNFKNINWVAFEGKTFGFHGGLQANEPIHAETKDKVVQEAIKSNALKGILLQDSWNLSRPKEMSLEESIARISLATDYALDFGRKAFCNRIPISHQQLEAMVKYLNSVNDQLVHQKMEYQWNPITNNCAHLVRNTLAAAGIRTYKSPDNSWLSNLLDPTMPSHLVLSNAEQAIPKELNDIIYYYTDEKSYRAIMDFGKLPSTHGTIFEVIPMHTKENTSYEMRNIIFTLSLPCGYSKRTELEEMHEKPQYSDLKSILSSYIGIYEKAIKTLKPIDTIIKEHPHLAKSDFRQFYTIYLNWLNNSLNDTLKKLDLLINAKNNGEPKFYKY